VLRFRETPVRYLERASAAQPTGIYTLYAAMEPPVLGDIRALYVFDSTYLEVFN
jgi:hypothetical protein